MAFDKVILGVITRTVKSTARFDIAVNSIKTQFDNKCPAPQELTKIIQSKNQINQALTQALGALSTIEKTSGNSSEELKIPIGTFTNGILMLSPNSPLSF